MSARVGDDRILIRELVENWVVWRDAGDWERFATVWHDDGFMMATWFQGPAPEFIRVSREGFERGVSILHFLGGSSVELAAKAPLSGAADHSPEAPPSGAADHSPRRRRQAPPTILLQGAAVRRRRQRPSPRDLADEDDDLAAGRRARGVVRCGLHRPVLRFPREARWAVGIVLRQPIYEKDRLDPVDPAAVLQLDADVLAGFPIGYRHLAYAQTRIGYDVKRDMPGLVGPGVERLYRRGAEWLAGGELGDPLQTVD